MRIKFFIFLMLIFSLTIALAKEKKEFQEEIPVKVMKVKLMDMEEFVDFVGTVKAQEEVLIYPKVTGKIIEKIKDIGDEVKKDEAIVYIDRDEVGFEFQKAPVLSTLDGIIGRMYVDIGQRVNINNPIALVVNMDKVKIILDIPEIYLSKISIGQVAKINIDAYKKEDFFGRVSKISPVVDVVSRSGLIEIIVDNQKHLLKSGMFARVRLILNTYKDSKVILKEAIIKRENETYVYVIENSRAILRKVKLGIRSGPYYQILDGINENDRVVILGHQRLSNGSSVIVEEMEGE